MTKILQDYAIDVENFTKDFGDVKAVDGLTLKIPEGEIFGLLGPNGSGKTTTINCLSGLVEPTSGLLKVGGFNVQKESKHERKILGICPQETAFFPYLSGKENVELFGELYSVPREQLKRNVPFILEKVGLTDDAKRRVSKYSGGMKRRVSIAMALVQDPKIVFLDEPTVGMDPQSRRAIWDFVVELKEEGKTILLTTHYLEEAEQLCDEVGIIDQGKLIELGSPEALKEKYRVKDLEEVFIQLTGRKIRDGA
ncbi:MAG: ABC transporter ATP-binding protein [Nitrososphaerota archaeon]|nr:ABC transporter ATP-binding protein [Nitrososphaerota archaeon]MDG6923619.1 ABC transporter ATP-binding protein [Nitrososphaerota archaeon]